MSDSGKSLGILLGIKPRRVESRSLYNPRLAAARRLRRAIKSDDDNADQEFYAALRAWESSRDVGPEDED